MELHIFFSFLLSLIAFIYLPLHILSQRNKTKFPLPPGNYGFPIIGETLSYVSSLRKGNVEEFVAKRKKLFSSEVFMTSLIGYPMAIFSGVEGNKFLFTNENKQVKVWFPKTVQKLFPKFHDKPITQDVIKVQKAFVIFSRGTPLQDLVGTIDSLTKKFIENYFDNRKQVNVRDIVGKYSLAVTCRLLFSLDDFQLVEKFAKNVEHIAAGILSLEINFPGTAFHRALKASKSLRKELEIVFEKRKVDLAEKRMSPTQDMLSHMLLSRDDNDNLFNEGDIASFLIAMLHAGFDPLRAELTFIMKYLAELPDVYNKVLAEQTEITKLKKQGELLNWEDTKKMTYSWSVAKEALRIMPPVVGTFREAATDFSYAGHVIPQGTKIHWNSHSTHNNPKYFPNPNKFVPSRFEGNGPPPFTFVPFGGGSRMCPATEFIKVAIVVFMHNLVTKFRWEKVIPNEEVVFDPHPRPTQGLPIRLHAHEA